MVPQPSLLPSVVTKSSGSSALNQVHLVPNADTINPAAACDIH